MNANSDKPHVSPPRNYGAKMVRPGAWVVSLRQAGKVVRRWVGGEIPRRLTSKFTPDYRYQPRIFVRYRAIPVRRIDGPFVVVTFLTFSGRRLRQGKRLTRCWVSLASVWRAVHVAETDEPARAEAEAFFIRTRAGRSHADDIIAAVRRPLRARCGLLQHPALIDIRGPVAACICLRKRSSRTWRPRKMLNSGSGFNARSEADRDHLSGGSGMPLSCGLYRSPASSGRLEPCNAEIQNFPAVRPDAVPCFSRFISLIRG
jgi:hypothetical protein